MISNLLVYGHYLKLSVKGGVRVDLFRKKSIDTLIAGSQQGKTLKKELSAFDLAFLGIGAIIGTGIFVLTGVGALDAGPALVISFIIAGLACAFAAFNYAEFASLVPVSGSVYTYSYATLGEFIAWVIGWDLMLEYILAVSAVSVGWSGYFTNFLAGIGIEIPASLTAAPGSDPGAIINLPSLVIVMIIAFLLSIGVKESKWVNNLMVALKLIVVALVIVAGVFYVKPDNWTPFMPMGWDGVGLAAATVFFAYLGFDAVSTAAEETRNPSRDLPKGILWSLGICTLLYILVSGIVTGIVPWQKFADHQDDPVAFALQFAGQDWVAGIISVGAAIGMMTVMLVMLYGQTRVGFAMSRDGLLPKWISKVHDKYRTPFASTWFYGTVCGLLGAFVPLDDLVKLVNMGTLAAFVLISVAVWVLRVKQPDLPRKFRCPWVPVLPILAIIFCGYLMFQLPGSTWLRFGIWLLIGIIFYFVYSRKNSKLNSASEAEKAS
ncbi:amino acid permease [Paenactinomyces guangxiensis]|uniref:Amino acid permease n=1 Tax=Paenactinomyces guangxiensis TaxID=1490290 RepID=A0A7W2A812_9BACL|nr:amino acid permease [Paenactinomyces guangxiensis]MBA4493697.1 amino acid permease [Paenactinomyces guangxiensis]MBH8590984.1 amino acid permease [Paenactinomyces guangxiensis]